ncbi:MAG: cupin domain-containing protein [Deltaproteobacteria bacterium]|nr:cupin domain-containing protein [Deltaproteobacteria bacterium]
MQSPTAALDEIERDVRDRNSHRDLAAALTCDVSAVLATTPHYQNRNERLAIDFAVLKPAIGALRVMDPRVVVIEPARTNERHRHAHESLFYVIAGRGVLSVGDREVELAAGMIAMVPRWEMHHARNTSADANLVLLAITDFGLTSAVLGDYDRKTRLREAGEDSMAPATAEVAP